MMLSVLSQAPESKPEESISREPTDLESGGGSSPSDLESGSSCGSTSMGPDSPSVSKLRGSETAVAAAVAAAAAAATPLAIAGVQAQDFEAAGKTSVTRSRLEVVAAPGREPDFQSWGLRSRRSLRAAEGLASSSRAQGESGEQQPRGPICTSNVKTLALTSFLFLSITVAQVLAARVANSRALLVDSISMGIDGLTFFCNIFVELRKGDGGEHLRSQLVVSAISLGCLTFFTIDALRESFGTALGCWGWSQEAVGSDEEDVNPYIVMAFAVVGLVSDLASLFAFWRSARKSGEESLNMCTALLHVGADCLRSITTLVMSLLILLGGMDGTCTDASASLIVGATILSGAAGGFWSWARKLVQLLRQGE
jgi:hypothetical protein